MGKRAPKKLEQGSVGGWRLLVLTASIVLTIVAVVGYAFWSESLSHSAFVLRHSQDEDRRGRAAQALAGSEREEYVALVQKHLLGDPSALVRRKAARAWARERPGNYEVLINALTAEPDREVRQALVTCLLKVWGRAPDRITRVFIKTLTDSDAKVRQDAEGSLQEVAATTEAGVPNTPGTLSAQAAQRTQLIWSDWWDSGPKWWQEGRPAAPTR